MVSNLLPLLLPARVCVSASVSVSVSVSVSTCVRVMLFFLVHHHHHLHWPSILLICLWCFDDAHPRVLRGVQLRFCLCQRSGRRSAVWTACLWIQLARISSQG